MNSITKMKRRIAQSVVLVSALALVGIAQAQYGNDAGKSSSSGSTSSTTSGQSSEKQKYDQSNAVDKGEEREKMERDVKDTIKRGQEHKLKPGNYSPPK